jgi:hypothetical protein
MPKRVDMRRRVLVFALLCCGYALMAQEPISIKIKDPIVCYANSGDHDHYVAPPQAYLDLIKRRSARTNSTHIEPTYIGFEGVPEAQQAFQRAFDIWEAVLNSPVTIHIEVRWVTLATNVLGSANYTSAFANFEGAQKLNVYYPVAIAEKITGRDLNPGEPDIFANFNRNFTWHYDPDDPNIPAGQYDLTTVVLHEIGHGLGFSGTFTVFNNPQLPTQQLGQYGLLGSGIPVIYDIPLERSGGNNLIESTSSPSDALATQLKSSLFFDAPSGRSKVYTPSTFNRGSSISHLDEITFNGTDDALMTPQIASQERIHSPGLALNMLGDLGWEIIRINHQKLTGTENTAGPYGITANIEADSGYNASLVMLHYSTNNGVTFTSLLMTPSGETDTFEADIPGEGTPQEYRYYISVQNEDGVEYTHPGKIVRPLNTQLQHVNVFETGPDSSPPKIVHEKQPFILDSETELVITAEISDNTGTVDAVLKYSINDVPQPDQALTLTSPEADSIYSVTLNIGSLVNGDQLKYRFVAVDHAINPNTGYSPSSTGYHILNIVGLGETVDSYANDFEITDLDEDFFGTGYTISSFAGFTGRAIHSEHPYASGNGFPGNERELIYQLRYPVRLKATEATLKFDEIALVEPGDPGSVFGGDNFYDYVIVEGSADGGQTWEFLLPGYDARAQGVWLARYNSSIDANGNSTATGDPSLYRPRTIDLLQTFEEGDEVVIRFRTYIDELANGWGWTIDNLKIQIDDSPPLILHDHTDYLKTGEDVLQIVSKVSDVSGIESYKLEYFVNDGEVQIVDFEVEPLFSSYEFSLTGLSALETGDTIQYRMVAIDKNENTMTFPPSGHVIVPIINFSSPIVQYSNNFDSPSADFVGNFFRITKPAGFTDNAIHTDHPYATGFGLGSTSDIIYTLKKPITISASNPLIEFNEIVLVEGHANGVAFGTEAFNDYVIVEGSKDGGETWNSFEDGYDVVDNSVWVTAFNSGSNGTPSLFRAHLINMSESGAFTAGDDVIIRFRLFSNETITGWGWAIDDLRIQDPITGIENQLETAIHIYPNPALEKIGIEADVQTSDEVSIQLYTPQGQKLYDATELPLNGKMMHTIAAGHLATGMYLVKISSGSKSVVRKVIKRN